MQKQWLHWPEYGSESLGIAFLVFIALSVVTFNFGPGFTSGGRASQ